MNTPPETAPGTGSDPSPGPRRTIVALIEDLLFVSKVREAASKLGLEVLRVSSGPALATALERGAVLLIVDLGAVSLDPPGSIRSAKALGIPVLAFGSHVNVEALEGGRRAGADEVVPRSVFSARLTELVQGLLRGTAS